MPITVAQTTAFFEQAAQMGIPNATVVQLREEGIETVADLADCDKETIEKIAASCRRTRKQATNLKCRRSPGRFP
jgi:predicted RecB family nuclease